MIRTAHSLMIVVCLGLGSSNSEFAMAQASKDCLQRERYSDALEHCTDVSPDDVIALGTVSVQQYQNGKKVILHDDKNGDFELLLTPSLVQAVDEYPADSFEVEGAVRDGLMTVKSLRPIE